MQGPLSHHLFQPAKRGLKPLSWERRLSIAVDVAKGVEYLHHLAHKSFIHRDLKPSNILLDNAYRAKVRMPCCHPAASASRPVPQRPRACQLPKNSLLQSSGVGSAQYGVHKAHHSATKCSQVCLFCLSGFGVLQVADFGLVKPTDIVDNFASVETRLAGTFGYLAPEYAGEAQGRGGLSNELLLYNVMKLLMASLRMNAAWCLWWTSCTCSMSLLC